MASESSQPPIAWRYCGNQMKLWRMSAGVSREELATEAGYEVETIKSMEQGRRKPTPRVLEIADEMCGAHGKLAAAQDYLKPEPFAPHTQEFMDAEAEAIAMSSYEPLCIPGLLQTEDYARALMSTHWPPMDEETREERVAGRMKRQEKLTRKPYTAFTYAIFETALRTGVGGPTVMKGQLEHLIEVSSLPNVSVQVLPLGRSAHGWLDGSFVLLETTERKQYGYIEGQDTCVLYSKAETVSSFTQRLGMLRMQALNVEETVEFIRKVMNEL